jgi:hypothetical protein
MGNNKKENLKSVFGRWISVESKVKPKEGQNVLVIQNPKTTATREPLFATYNAKTKRFMKPDKYFKPKDKDGFIHLGWSEIIYWVKLPSVPKNLL